MVLRTVKHMETERAVDVMCWGRKDGELVFNGNRVSFRKMKSS